MPKTALQVKTTGEVVTLDLSENELEILQTAVGGWVEAIDLTDEICMWCNEEGKLDGLAHNKVAQKLFDNAFGAKRDEIVGDVVFTGGIDDEGDTKGLTVEQVEAIKETVEKMSRSGAFAVSMASAIRSKRWEDHLGDAPMTEENVWQAIADANGLDYSEIADGDLFEWL